MFFTIVLFTLLTWTCLWLYAFIMAQDDLSNLTSSESEELFIKNAVMVLLFELNIIIPPIVYFIFDEDFRVRLLG